MGRRASLAYLAAAVAVVVATALLHGSAAPVEPVTDLRVNLRADGTIRFSARGHAERDIGNLRGDAPSQDAALVLLREALVASHVAPESRAPDLSSRRLLEVVGERGVPWQWALWTAQVAADPRVVITRLRFRHSALPNLAVDNRMPGARQFEPEPHKAMHMEVVLALDAASARTRVRVQGRIGAGGWPVEDDRESPTVPSRWTPLHGERDVREAIGQWRREGPDASIDAILTAAPAVPFEHALLALVALREEGITEVQLTGTPLPSAAANRR
jgi:hypothetical protein